MLTQHIALVPAVDGADLSELARVSAALQTQVTRDLAPVWGVTATIAWFPTIEDLPLGYWPILVAPGDLGGHAGVHIDRNGVPYAQISTSAPHWSIDASRACLELLINPVELRTVIAPSPRADQSSIEVLVEVCGPCADERFGYYVNDVLVSDFCTPTFFISLAANGGLRDIMRASQGLRSSFAGSLSAPLQILPGGHLAWHDPAADQWWVRSHWGENPVDTKLGAVDRRVASVRELIGACSPPRRSSAGNHSQTFQSVRDEHAAQAASARADHVRRLASTRFESDFDAAFDVLQLREQVRGETKSLIALLRAPSAPRSSPVLEEVRVSRADARADTHADTHAEVEPDASPQPTAASTEPATRASRSVPPPLPSSIAPVALRVLASTEREASKTVRPIVYGTAAAFAAAALFAIAVQSRHNASPSTGISAAARQPTAMAPTPAAAAPAVTKDFASKPKASASARPAVADVTNASNVNTKSKADASAAERDTHGWHRLHAKVAASPSRAPVKAPSLDDLIESRK